MKRRDFIKTGITTGLVTGAALAFGNTTSIFKTENNYAVYDLVAVKGGKPDAMFDKGIQALGGMKSFIKAGQTVVVKPNIGWDVSPERAANTNPALVKRIIEHCFNAGAKTVYVFDNTCDNWAKCYQNSGIEKAAKEAGAKVAPANTESYYQSVSISKAKKLKSAKVHELILESDVFINVPVLKHHSSADMTLSMKNLMGVVWDRRYWHLHDLHQCIADYATFSKKPTLNIIDAYRVLMKNGPRGTSEADVKLFQSQIISTDMVAADAAAISLFGKKPEDVRFMRIASDMNIGQIDLNKLKIARLNM